MRSIMIVENEYLLHFCGKIKKGLYELSDLHKITTENDKIYERKENDVLLNVNVLKNLIEKLKTSSECKLKISSLVLPHALSWYHFLEVENYPKNENEAIEFIIWKIQKIMPIPRDNAEIRVQILRKERAVTKLLVVATFKSFLRSLEGILVHTGVEPALIVTPTLSFMNVFEKSLPKNGIVYWLRDRDFSQIILKDDIPIYIREVDRPLEISRIDFETMSMLSNIRERFEDYNPEETVIFDEMERIGLENYFSERVRVLNIRDKIANPKIGIKITHYVCGLGVLNL